MQQRPTLYLMLGYPGAGKTTIARIIADTTGAVRLSSDQFRVTHFKNPTFSQDEHDAVYSGLNKETQQLLQKGKSVVYDANLNRYIHRKEKYDIAHKLGVNVQLIWINTPKHIAKQRATQDGENDPHRPFGNLKTDVFNRLSDELEPPRSEEPCLSIVGIDVTKDTVREALDGTRQEKN